MTRVYTGAEIRQARLEAAEYVERWCSGVMWLAAIVGFLALAIFGPGILSGSWAVPVVVLALLALTRALTQPANRIRRGNEQAASVESSASTSASTAASRN